MNASKAEPKSKFIDWSGQKYLFLKEKGYNINLYFVRSARPDRMDEPTRFFARCHSKSDGIGAFTDLLISFFGKTIRQPLNQKIPKPPLLPRIFQLIKYLWSTRPIEYHWRYQNDNKVMPESISMIWFNEKDTIELLNCAKTQNISLNSLLLWSLDHAICENLLSDFQNRSWLIPVNMRGGLEILDSSANHTASLSLRFQRHIQVKDLDRLIKKLYNEGQAWGSWIYSNIHKYFSSRLIHMIYKNYRSCWLGVFTNLGVWPNSEIAETLSANPWAAVGPITPLNPIMASALTWQGQLSLCLRIDPTKLGEAKTKNSLLDISEAWSKTLAEQCKNPMSPRVEIASMDKISKVCEHF